MELVVSLENALKLQSLILKAKVETFADDQKRRVAPLIEAEELIQSVLLTGLAKNK